MRKPNRPGKNQPPWPANESTVLPSRRRSARSSGSAQYQARDLTRELIQPGRVRSKGEEQPQLLSQVIGKVLLRCSV
jgi:hypothetical protein